MFSLLLALAVAGGSGQDTTEAHIGRLRARVDSLRIAERAVFRRLYVRDSLREAERLGQGVGQIDTAQVGPFLVVAAIDELPRVRRVFEKTWTERGERMGARRALANAVFLVEGDEPIGVFDAMRRAPNHYEVSLHWYTGGRLNDRIAWRALQGAITMKLSTELRVWLQGAQVAGDSAETVQQAYRDLAITRYSVARACFAGDAARCLDALGLTDPGPRFERRYSAEELRLAAWPRRGSATAPRERQRHPCFTSVNAEACLELIPNRSLLIPTAPASRVSFLDHMLREGGEAALARLQSLEGVPVEQQLAAIAGDGLQNSAARWLQQVQAAQPRHTTASITTTLSTLVWIVVLGLIAARSTRWRLG